MTLIELLITMVIIAIISAAILGTASAAFENARRSRTQSLITKISGLVLERWDSYANRRVDINRTIEVEIDNWANAPNLTPLQRSQRSATRGQLMADARLLALRELMKFEMPDRWSDFLNTPVMLDPTRMPPIAQMYNRRYLEVSGHDEINTYQSAECLYLIVMYATGDGEARTMFNTQDIGDVDGDGAPEFVDGWGQPLQWIRWPAGFVSDLQPVDNDGRRFADDHDPFDIFRRDAPDLPGQPPKPNYDVYPNIMEEPISLMRVRNAMALTAPAGPPYRTAFRLVPLIFSIGPDEDADVILDSESSTELDPYKATYGDSGDLQLGQQLDQEGDGEGWRDNIYSHLNQY